MGFPCMMQSVVFHLGGWAACEEADEDARKQEELAQSFSEVFRKMPEVRISNKWHTASSEDAQHLCTLLRCDSYGGRQVGDQVEGEWWRRL
eukprot:3412681-Amphidinium_carterae.1